MRLGQPAAAAQEYRRSLDLAPRAGDAALWADNAAAELALCGARLGKFWRLHDLLFKYQDTWAPLKEPGPFLLSLADSASVPHQAMEACLTTGVARPEIEADVDGARRSGAQSTPTFYIEGGLLVGAQPPDVWKQILDSIYAAKTSKK